MKVTLYCPLCGDSTSADVEMNPAWSAPDDIEDERWSLCPKHATVREFKDAVCPGCVSSWGDCPMFDAFAYSGRRTISGTDYAALEHGRCPRRVNGTFAIRDASIEDLEEVIAARLDKIFAFDYGNADALIEFDETQDLSTHIAAYKREWRARRAQSPVMGDTP